MKFSLPPVFLILGFFLGSCDSGETPPGVKVEGERVVVDRVVSANTLEVLGAEGQNAAIQQIRLIGIEAPDFRQDPWGDAAKQQLESLIDGQPLLLELDRQSEDSYGRRLAYVWRDGMLLNEELVKQGYALASSRSPNTKHELRLAYAQEWARLMGVGIWDPQNPLRQTPSEFRRDRR